MRLRSRAPRVAWSAQLASGVLLGTALALSACTGESESGSEPAVAAAPAAPVALGDLSGIYRVAGTTVQQGGFDAREISGTVTLRVEGDQYTSSYNLKTTFPGREDDLIADVVGTGSGMVEGASFAGTSQTQLVIASVPGVDPSFAFIPRVVGLRLTSTTLAHFEADGTVTMHSQNLPGEGEDYIRTRTTLTGERIAERAANER